MTKTKNPSKQRLKLYTASKHTRRKWMASHLHEDLLMSYNTRAVTVRKGDTVKILRGETKGHTGKVSAINTNAMYVEVEGANITKADGKQVPRKIHPSNLLITKLDLSDKRRKEKLESLGGRKK